MSSIDTAIVSTAVGASAALLGVLLQSFLGGKDRRQAEEVGRLDESARWARDQQLRAVESFSLSYQRVRNALRFLAKAEPGSAEALEHHATIRHHAEEFNSSLVSLRIFASASLIESAMPLDEIVDDFLGRLLSDIQGIVPLGETEAYQDFRRSAATALDAFVDVARRELRADNDQY